MVSLKRLNFRKTPTNVREMQIFTRRHQYAKAMLGSQKDFHQTRKNFIPPLRTRRNFFPIGFGTNDHYRPTD